MNGLLVCLAALALSTLLSFSGCGGGKDPVAVLAAPARGTLLQNPPQLLSTQSVAALLSQLSVGANQVLLALSGIPLCDIQVYQIRYATVGGTSEATAASGAMMVPSGLDPNCHGARPVVLYAHGTTTDRAFNIANLSDPQNAEGLLMAALFAAQGYIVVAPNYAGYDSSTLAYHPYLNGDQQSKDMIDALAAARSALPARQAPLTTDSGRLFITGYSQGGYVAMATHRAMQTAGMKVTASAPMSGPYALEPLHRVPSAAGDEVAGRRGGHGVLQGQAAGPAPVVVAPARAGRLRGLEGLQQRGLAGASLVHAGAQARSRAARSLKSAATMSNTASPTGSR